MPIAKPWRGARKEEMCHDIKFAHKSCYWFNQKKRGQGCVRKIDHRFWSLKENRQEKMEKETAAGGFWRSEIPTSELVERSASSDRYKRNPRFRSPFRTLDSVPRPHQSISLEGHSRSELQGTQDLIECVKPWDLSYSSDLKGFSDG